MFITDNNILPAFVDSDDSFIVKEMLWLTDSNQSNDYLYQQIVFKVLRKPKKLMFHLQRIYFTYSLGMEDQLYAALVDLLWILDGKGTALSYRMLKATQSKLTGIQVKALDEYIKTLDIDLLVANKFSVCTKGVISSLDLFDRKTSATPQEDYDPLKLAKDYIEYSQLDAALETLETALFKTPDRKDLQIELLGLLKKTNDVKAFERIKKDLLAKTNWEESLEWLEIAEYFAGMSNEE